MNRYFVVDRSAFGREYSIRLSESGSEISPHFSFDSAVSLASKSDRDADLIIVELRAVAAVKVKHRHRVEVEATRIDSDSPAESLP